MQPGKVLVVQSGERGLFRAVFVLQTPGGLGNALDGVRAIVQPPRPVDLFDRGRELADLQRETIFKPLTFARSAEEMRARIVRYRRSDPNDRSDFIVGCRILTQPFFWDEADWLPPPADWSPAIVAFKTCSTD